MNRLLADLLNQWNALASRTRRLIVAGTIMVAALLLYAAAWLPLQRDLAQLRARVPLEAEQLNWMRAQAPAVKAMRAKFTASAGAPIPGIEQSALTHGVRSYITKLEAEGGTGARVTFEAVPFNTLVTWMSEVQAAQGLVVEEATINVHASPGAVNAQLRFRTGT